MKTLSEKLKTLLLMAVKQSGSYNPDDTLFYIEEHLTGQEYDTAKAFLTWIHQQDWYFGEANIKARYKEWLNRRYQCT
jgi:hypothetical protein